MTVLARMARHLATLTLAALTLAALALTGVPASADEDWTRALAAPAARLWAPLPAGARIALQPLDPDESGLPEAVLADVEGALTAALLAAAPPGGQVLTRRDLSAVWDEAASFAEASSQSLLAGAVVDALVVAAVAEQGGALSVAARLVGLRDGALGEVLATAPPVVLDADLGQADVVQAQVGARRLGIALAETLRLSADPAAAFASRIERRGPRGAAADWFAGLVAEHLMQRLATPPLYVTRPLSRLGAPPETRVVRLELDLWDQGDRVDVQVRAAMGPGEAHATARIALASIPRGFLPLTRDGGLVGQGLYRAVGTFSPTRPTDPREVRFAARVLARAALIDDALGRGGGHAGAGTAREVAAAMGSLARALPHEEIWRDRPAGGAGAVQELAARLARLGGTDAPRIEAAVERALYRPGEALSARVVARNGRAYVAAYAWQADDTVVRIAPTGREARLLEADRRADLPGPADAQVTAAALPGSQESQEALVLVASAVPFLADALAPLVGETPQGSLAAAAQMSAFLDALAGLDLSRVSVTVLPYRTRAPD